MYSQWSKYIFPGVPALAILLVFAVFTPGPARGAEHNTDDTHSMRLTVSETETDVHDSNDGHKPPAGYKIPPLWAMIPFALLLLSIAILPLFKITEHWWEYNRNRLLVAVSLSALTLIYYWWIHPGVIDHGSEALRLLRGFEAVTYVLKHAVLGEYIPFIVLMFSLYVISGGVRIEGDLPACPAANTLLLAIGAGLASFIGTTGAAMLLIRPLLRANGKRTHVRHTVVFFIFLVCNVGGALLPIGDPPLFLGYLKGVPFLWTLKLWPQWLATMLVLLLIYFIWDSLVYRGEPSRNTSPGLRQLRTLRLRGGVNLLWLIGVVLAVALLVPHRPLFGRENWPIIPVFLRETVQLLFVGLSLATTPAGIRRLNKFGYTAIAEVAVLFIGIFITMQVPVEILSVKGPTFGLTSPWHFFWATGLLSSILDNAPTYVCLFETATTIGGPDRIVNVAGELLAAISLGAVFMGANTYIGNGPNFMVKSIAEQNGVEMPGFFGYMLYSLAVLMPVFLLITFVLNYLVGRWLLL